MQYSGSLEEQASTTTGNFSTSERSGNAGGNADGDSYAPCDSTVYSQVTSQNDSTIAQRQRGAHLQGQFRGEHNSIQQTPIEAFSQEQGGANDEIDVTTFMENLNRVSPYRITLLETLSTTKPRGYRENRGQSEGSIASSSVYDPDSSATPNNKSIEVVFEVS